MPMAEPDSSTVGELDAATARAMVVVESTRDDHSCFL